MGQQNIRFLVWIQFIYWLDPRIMLDLGRRFGLELRGSRGSCGGFISCLEVVFLIRIYLLEQWASSPSVRQWPGGQRQVCVVVELFYYCCSTRHCGSGQMNRT